MGYHISCNNGCGSYYHREQEGQEGWRPEYQGACWPSVPVCKFPVLAQPYRQENSVENGQWITIHCETKLIGDMCEACLRPVKMFASFAHLPVWLSRYGSSTLLPATCTDATFLTTPHWDRPLKLPSLCLLHCWTKILLHCLIKFWDY